MMKKIIKFILDIPGPSVYKSISVIFSVLFFIVLVVPFMAVDWYNNKEEISIFEHYRRDFKKQYMYWFFNTYI